MSRDRAPTEGAPEAALDAEAINTITSDEAVTTTDEIIETTDESIATVEPERPRIVTESLAMAALRDAFGAVTDADYVPGKTQFREALRARFDLSDVEAEALCDALEEAGLLRFVRTDDEIGWHLHHEI